MFAHLHSSPLVVRRRQGSEWRSLSASTASPADAAAAASRSYGSGLEAVEIIDVKEERKLLVQCVREAKKRIVWHSEVADLHTFRKVLSFGCRALHFSGHGVPGKVIFETKQCEAQFISQQELKDLLLAGGTDKGVRPRLPHISSDALVDSSSSGMSDSDDSDAVSAHEVERGWIALDAHPRPPVPVKLVFVSACHSESVAEAFVSVGVPHVVVVSKDDKVLDKKAMEFAKAFYTALFAGHAVAKAFEIGQVQADISITSDAGNSKFKLLGSGDHSEALFRDVPDGAFIEHSPPRPVNECDAVAEVFVGRSIEVHHAYKSLVEGARLVSITGERGIGKTEIALQCAQYATERHLFQHIYFARLELDDFAALPHESAPPRGAAALVRTLAKSFGLLTGDTVAAIRDADDLVHHVRLQCADSGRYLLILDGCNRRTRQDVAFRAIVSLLLRRVSSLALLLTGDSKLGALDGVGEKIVAVDRLPPADAALLFTLRAPRKIRAHEMGGSPDLAAFGDHPVVRSLQGHPRTICAVSQFLETKDMELDQHEFLNYIIPSVNAGLSARTFDQTASSSASAAPNLPPCIADMIGASHATAADAPRQHSHHVHQPQSWNGHRSSGAESLRRMRPAASQSNVLTKAALDVADSDRPYPLMASHSESDLVAAMSAASQRQMCVLKVADHVKWAVPSEDGRLVWAHTAVAHANVVDDAYTAAVVHELLSLREMPLDWIAPHVSTYFASQLKHDAVTRPLSLRSIDFLSKSTLVWGCGSSPAQRRGAVTLEMFAAFWDWFAPLTECIQYSRLWSFTQPRLLHGFLSKGACVTMLQRAPPGTFLLRFSETRRRCVVIAYVHDDQCVQFVPVTCTRERSGWSVALQGDSSGATFSTLHDLILSVSVLKFLFPQTPKEVAFRLHG